MTDYLGADTEGMRGKVAVLGQAEQLARRIGETLQNSIAANEPIADWETDEITAGYLKVYQQAKEFVGQVFEFLPPAVGGSSEQTAYLTQLLDQVEEQNAEEAERPVTNTGGGKY